LGADKARKNHKEELKKESSEIRACGSSRVGIVTGTAFDEEKPASSPTTKIGQEGKTRGAAIITGVRL